MTKIGWVPFKKSYSDKYHLIESLERMIKEPEKILDFYKKTNSMFKQCPSNFNFLKNFYVIKSPFDVEIKYFREVGSARVEGKYNGSVITGPKDTFLPHGEGT